MHRSSLFLIASLLLPTATFGACSNSTPLGSSCDGDRDCREPQVCRASRCVLPGDAGPPDAGEDGAVRSCGDGRPFCGRGAQTECCDATELCVGDQCVSDCRSGVSCDGSCCDVGQECLDGSCVIECAEERRCGGDGSLCCSASEACLQDRCVPPGETCERTEQCPLAELCEPTLGRCVPRDLVEVCEFRPEPGDFTPMRACQWRPPAGPYEEYAEVVMTPAVANLTDDNGDGVTDTRDVPDIVFVSNDRQAHGCCSFRGVLRIASGRCNEDGSMETIATFGDDPWVDVSGGVAVGNLHPASMTDERAPEIVAYMGGGNVRNADREVIARRPSNGLVAFRRTSPDGSTWEVLWRSEDLRGTEEVEGVPSADHSVSTGQPGIADLDGDGAPEVFLGNVVLDGLTGETKWDGLETVGPEAGIGHNAFLGPASTAADIDLDGVMELIAGNTVYDGRDGREKWTTAYPESNSVCSSGRFDCDGYNAVGNFDADPEGEVVSVRRGQVYVFEHDGTIKTMVDIPWEDCGQEDDPPRVENESGPPTVADFDGDGRPEIGTASADFYVVVDFDCVGDPLPEGCEAPNILWTVPNEDCSSRATGSSVFDFEGDGKAEVVYADESSFRIFDGATGAVLYQDDSHSSNTRMEMPIVVDVDNDGKSEVVVPEPNSSAPDVGGIEIWEDAENNWVRTRRIWNQHTYHVTNVTEDGQIPAVEEPNWSNGRLNNFRQNVQPAGLFDAPDLVITDIERLACLVEGILRIGVTIANEGALGVPPGIAVHVRAMTDTGEALDLGVQRTTMGLLPGQSEQLVFELEEPGGFAYGTVTFEAFADDDGTGAGQYNECDEDNGVTSEPIRTCTVD